MKQCSKCLQLKPTNTFSRDSNRNDKLTPWCKKCQKEYYTVNRKKRLLYLQGWRKRNPNYYKEVEQTTKRRFKHCKDGAKRRGYLFKLSYEEYINLSMQECYYCGEIQKIGNGVDRLNNSKGYIKGNCVSCCRRCNVAKNIYTKEEYILKCRKVVEKWGTVQA